jgi:galactokinase
LIDETLPSFQYLFGRPPAVTKDAPGRVNLIGEHTDYNEGFVLPIATPQRTTVALAWRHGRGARVWSANVAPDERWAEFTVEDERCTGGWIDYVQGVTFAMRKHGWRIGGFDARVESSLPLGAGLSSSASLEIAFVRTLAAARGLTIDGIEMARIGHLAETGFVRAPVGIMDQMAASFATSGAALFLDTRTLEYERVALPDNTELMVIDSGITHRHAGGEYKTRRGQCDEAARCLGVAALRDVAVSDVRIASLPEPLNRRVRHVVTENGRVLHAREALRRNDAGAFAQLMNESHASMRDDFEVSTPQIDRLVQLAQAQEGVLGARLTGGGFGGAIVALVRRGHARAAASRVVAQCARELGLDATALIP